MMELEKGVEVIGKVEMNFELVTKAQNLQLHIKCDTLCDHTTHSIYNTLVRESYILVYYGGQQLEFLTLTKPNVFLFISCN